MQKGHEWGLKNQGCSDVAATEERGAWRYVHVVTWPDLVTVGCEHVGQAAAMVGGGWQNWKALDGHLYAETLGGGTLGAREDTDLCTILPTSSTIHLFLSPSQQESPRKTHFSFK